jgi:hypothetical protein
MTDDTTLRPYEAYAAEDSFLGDRIDQVEKAMGRLAARLGEPTPITQPLDVVDRAREITADVRKQVRLRPLEDAVAAQLAWLDRAEQRAAAGGGEPVPDLNRIALDRRLLRDLLAAWHARGN